MMLSGLPKEEIEKKIEDRRKLMPERERFNPTLIGQKNLFTWGSYGSRQDKVIKAKLATMGLKYTEQDLRNIQAALAEECDKQVALNKELMNKKKPGYLLEAEFESLIRKVIRA
jgi:hypothetical protein